MIIYIFHHFNGIWAILTTLQTIFEELQSIFVTFLLILKLLKQFLQILKHVLWNFQQIWSNFYNILTSLAIFFIIFIEFGDFYNIVDDFCSISVDFRDSLTTFKVPILNKFYWAFNEVFWNPQRISGIFSQNLTIFTIFFITLIEFEPFQRHSRQFLRYFSQFTWRFS